MFGVSTHLYVGDRLDRDHLVEIAAHGFDAVEVFAVRDHFDYRDRRAAIALAEWLDDTRLTPAFDARADRRRVRQRHVEGRLEPGRRRRRPAQGGGRRSAGDARRRRGRALQRARRALRRAGAARDAPATTTAARWCAASKSCRRWRQRYGVRLAIEVIPNELSTPSALVELIESDIDATGLGICMDVGHARMMGDVVDAIETCSGHLITTHLHDNRGRSDDHLVPGKGVIDWDAAMLAFQKVGYDGVVDVRARGRRRTAADPRAGRQGARAIRIVAAHRRRNAGRWTETG